MPRLFIFKSIKVLYLLALSCTYPWLTSLHLDHHTSYKRFGKFTSSKQLLTVMELDSLPDLQLGSDALMDFLKSGLQQLEHISGEEDDEARRLLQMLEQQTVLMQTMSGHADGAPAMTDLEIAHQIDNLDAQLSRLEASLGAADAPTMQLLGQSTSKWLSDCVTADQHPAQISEQQAGSPTAQQAAASTGLNTAAAQQDSSPCSSRGDTIKTESSNLQHQLASTGSSHQDNSTEGRLSATSAVQQLAADGGSSASSAVQQSAAAGSLQDP